VLSEDSARTTGRPSTCWARRMASSTDHSFTSKRCRRAQSWTASSRARRRA